MVLDVPSRFHPARDKADIASAACSQEMLFAAYL